MRKTIREQLFEQVTLGWTDEDWKTMPMDKLNYHIGEFMDENQDESDVLLLAYNFEVYMGW